MQNYRNFHYAAAYPSSVQHSSIFNDRRRLDELRSRSRRHTQRRIYIHVRWQAQGLEDLRAALHGLGDLPHEGIAGGSEPDLRVADVGLVRPATAALG